MRTRGRYVKSNQHQAWRIASATMIALLWSGTAAAQDKDEEKKPPRAQPAEPVPVPARPVPDPRRPDFGDLKERLPVTRTPGAPERLRPPPPVLAPEPPALPQPSSPLPDEPEEADPADGLEFKAMSPREKLTFNLEEADLPELVRLISNITGRRFILPGKIRSIKATVLAPTEVTAGEAYRAFLSILEVNGLTVVPSGRYLKIVETGGIETQPLPIYGAGSAIPSVDRYITQLLYVENVSAEDVSSLLTRFKSKEGNIAAYAPTNMLIITDTGTQIRRMMRLIKAIDVPRTGTQTWIEPIHHANATEIATRLQEIFPVDNAQPSTPRARPRTPTPARAGAAANEAVTIGEGTAASIRNIIADERTNSLIIIASERAYLRILEMIRQLDVSLEGEGRIHVHYIQHSAATEIAAALSNLVGGGTGAAATRRPTGRAGQAQTAVAPAGSLFEGDIRVTAYEPSNALIITSSLHDYAAIKRVIERLDAPRRQVFIEAVVMELGVSSTNRFGLSYHAGIGNVPTEGSLSVLGFDSGTTIGGLAGAAASQDFLTGLAVGVQGPTINNSQQLVGFSVPGFGVAVSALAGSGDVNVLSTPHIIAMDNVEAEISVGENIPLQTSGVPAGALTAFAGVASAAGQAPGAGALTGAGGVPRQDVGTTIRITPHINEANEMRLEIEEEISEKGATEGTLGVVSINRRTARTELMVRDQQTVVIGGLMRDSKTTGETKIPVLGDIPILGALFRKKNSESRKTNLILFLTPYIIRDPSDLRAIFERKMQERQEFIDRFFVMRDGDYEPVVDYSRTRGLVTEIINEIDDVDEEVRLAKAAMSEPPPGHVPRAPVGSYIHPGEGAIFIGPDGEEAEDAEATGTPVNPELPSDSELPIELRGQ